MCKITECVAAILSTELTILILDVLIAASLYVTSVVQDQPGCGLAKF